MKYLKIMGLAAIAAAALMAFAGTASATVLTSPEGTQLGKGTKISSKLSSAEAILHAEFGEVKCKKSTVEGEITNPGSATETVSGPITALTFTECNCEVKVLKTGELEIHTKGETSNGNGTLTGKGSEVTTSCPSIFGQQHCIWSTTKANGEATDLGTLTGGAPAKLNTESAKIRHSGGTSALCGAEGTWNAEYEVTSPNPLFVD